MKTVRSMKLGSLIVVMLFSATSQVSADSQSGGLSYSPDHWPNRWSSAIRQKQNGKFPTRKKQQQSMDLRQLENSKSVSEQDLFYSPDSAHRFNREYSHDQFDDRAARYRHIRDVRRLSREAAFAYNDMANMTGPYGGYGPYFGGGTYGISIDPVLGHPGIGIPIMPGTPMGYPMGLYPFGAYPGGGYPFGVGAWNPPFGMW